MRNALLIFFGLLLYPEISKNDDFRLLKYSKNQLELLEIQEAIKVLRPRMHVKHRKLIAKELKRVLKGSKIDWKRYLSILFQESSLRVDPARAGKTCKNRYKKCLDFGIGQVSYFYWGKKLKINRKKAVEDLKYSISLSFIVYLHYYKKYAKRDKKWYTRYHSGTPSKRRAYEKRINAHYDKIVVAQNDFRRAILYGQKDNTQCYYSK